MSTAADNRCPIPGGIFGLDFEHYRACESCKLAASCKRKKRLDVKDRLQRVTGGWTLRHVQVPLGLLQEPTLLVTERLILSVVLYSVHPEWGCSYLSDAQIARIIGVDRATTSRCIRGYTNARGEQISGLIDAGWLRAETVQKNKRTVRRLLPTLRLIRAADAYEPKTIHKAWTPQ